MIDLDHFKKFNDSHGHLAGDEALRTAAQVLSHALRPTDFAVHYGGEEMMVLLPDTNDQVAVLVAQRLCERMQQAVVFSDMRLPLPHITASFGVASLAAMCGSGKRMSLNTTACCIRSHRRWATTTATWSLVSGKSTIISSPP